MVMIVTIASVAFLVSALTLFSGFGLGTVLMPAFAVFLPLPTAIAATAVVHLAHNLFKAALLGRNADWSVVVRFGFAAAVSAFAGASALLLFADLPALTNYEMSGREFSITPVKLVIGVLITVFALLELSPAFARLTLSRRYLIAGGLLTGFFGGLSGNQGALRSAFLIKLGLSKEAFVATGTISTVIVDTVRLTVYGASYFTASFEALPPEIMDTVAAAIVAAFAGVYFGQRLLQKVTFRNVQLIAATFMILVGVGLAIGVV